MGDTTIKKIDSSHSPIGDDGQIYLASGKALSMRLWKEEQVSKDVHDSEREYETVGYVIQGRAELHSEGQSISLGPGDSWLVPKGAKHHYQIVEPFTAIEATSPPAEIHGRDNSEQIALAETPKEDDHGQKHDDKPADDNKTQEKSTGQEHEEKARHDQEVAAKIPRTSKNITSNAPEKEPKPSEHVDVKEREKSS